MKKLTQRELEQREVKEVVVKIEKLKQQYGLNITRRACNQFYLYTGEKLRLQREIAEKEKELQRLKKKV